MTIQTDLKRALLTDVDRFVEDHPTKNIGFFFHTSAVAEQYDNLEEYFQKIKAYRKQGKMVCSYLSKNCVYELKLLEELGSDVARCREKASLLLKSCYHENTWSYQDIRKYKDQFLKCYSLDCAVFVFYDPASADDFSRRLGALENVIVFSYNPYLFHTLEGHGQRIYRSGCEIRRRCSRLKNAASPQQTKYSPKPTDLLTVTRRDGTVVRQIKGSELRGAPNCPEGGEARVYCVDEMPGKLLKIYHKNVGEGMVKKLKCMMINSKWLPHCVLPTELLYVGDRCIGYVMDRLEGRDLRTLFNQNEYTDEQSLELAKKLSAVVMELRCRQFEITDFSEGNVFVDNHEKVWIIDCDSMEYVCYPGGGTTYPFGHPDVDAGYFNTKLRTRQQVDFSYAVMLFDLLLGWSNPLTQGGAEKPLWRGEYAFPFTTDSKGRGTAVDGAIVPETKLRNWCRQSTEVRTGFEDVFNFREIYDIGEWMRRLGFFD